jgi:hypothetical protein
MKARGSDYFVEGHFFEFYPRVPCGRRSPSTLKKQLKDGASMLARGSCDAPFSNRSRYQLPATSIVSRSYFMSQEEIKKKYRPLVSSEFFSIYPYYRQIFPFFFASCVEKESFQVSLWTQQYSELFQIRAGKFS